MEAIWSSIHTHQFAVVAIVIAALIIIYFLFKNLIKLALLFLLIMILTGGYFYLTAPKKSPEDLNRAIEQTQEQTAEIIDKGKVAYEKGKEVVERGKELTDRFGKVIGGNPRRD
jgi:membrane protein implicated in regulation of membrane protease activity